MFEIINICPIIKKHFRSLTEDTKICFLIIIFGILPILVSYIAVFFNLLIGNELISTLVASFSIFVGFTINVLVLLLQKERHKDDTTNKLIKHLAYNSLYELLLGLIILIITLIVSLLEDYITNDIRCVLSFILYILIINFFFTLLIIAKRIFAVFQKGMESHGGKNDR